MYGSVCIPVKSKEFKCTYCQDIARWNNKIIKSFEDARSEGENPVSVPNASQPSQQNPTVPTVPTVPTIPTVPTVPTKPNRPSRPQPTSRPNRLNNNGPQPAQRSQPATTVPKHYRNSFTKCYSCNNCIFLTIRLDIYVENHYNIILILLL